MFGLSTEKMQAIVAHFEAEMKKGLQRAGESVAMIPTFVTGRPTGQEKGRYLSLDFGGNFLRMCEVDLRGSRDFRITQQQYMVPPELMAADMRDLCDFIADCVDNFLAETGKTDVTMLQMGFTFSFPVNQTSINRGVLKQWTKGFSCPNAVDRDIVVMLQEAFFRKGIPVNIAAIVNDAVGTLMALGYCQPDTAIGVILGTGTNACYYEKLDRIAKWDGGPTGSDDMVINTEWGGFDNERVILPMTMFDRKVDRESSNPRQQTFEKMISGMYLGEVTRNCILYYVDRQLLFNGYSSAILNQQYAFDTPYMSDICRDDEAGDLPETRYILEEILQIRDTTLTDRRIVKAISDHVGRRAARLTACGLAALLKHCSLVDQRCTIGIDGSLFEYYPGFDSSVMQALVELYGPGIEQTVSFSIAHDGSGLGAAIVAMIAHKTALQCRSRQHSA
ncbi:hypothetical protein BX666DRAFT_2019601 [Dichotomocladium elegans]|nr:hypothetical protein BX666DRAFT_2019601 [Dichotomocladium elegans]